MRATTGMIQMGMSLGRAWDFWPMMKYMTLNAVR